MVAASGRTLVLPALPLGTLTPTGPAKAEAVKVVTIVAAATIVEILFMILNLRTAI